MSTHETKVGVPAARRIKELLEEDRRKRDARSAIEHTLLTTTRAGKLLLRGPRFVVVDEDEPYYLEVYRMIRHNARRRGTWTSDCEQEFQNSLHRWADRSPVVEK